MLQKMGGWLIIGEMKFDVIFFIGPQGSGKGTQARLLATKLGFYFWEMGGILREIGKENSVLGKKIKVLLDAGILVPDQVILEILDEKLPGLMSEKGLVFDGVPRQLGQAVHLLSFLEKNNKQKMVTIFIDLPKEESIKRLLLRAEKEGRVDDNKESIEMRLSMYEKQTVPVLDFLREKTTFITIDGSPEIEMVTEQINYALEGREDKESN